MDFVIYGKVLYIITWHFINSGVTTWEIITSGNGSQTFFYQQYYILNRKSLVTQMLSGTIQNLNKTVFKKHFGEICEGNSSVSSHFIYNDAIEIWFPILG
jgi:hypothetical protein